MAVILSERAEVRRDARLRPRRLAGRRPALAAALDRTRRSIGQVALFAVFGIGGATIGALVVPLCSVFVRDPVRRADGVRSVVYHFLRAYVGGMQALQLIDLEVIGLDRPLPPGSLIVANHPSLIDALILLGRIKGGVVVAKRSLQISPFTGGGIRGANYIVNADPVGLVDECRARIAAGETLVLFPECTRTAADGVIRLRRGAAQIAVRSGCPMIPLTIEFSEPLLDKQSRWWLAPRVKPRVRVVRHEPIDPAEFVRGHRSVTLVARRLTEHLQAFYVKELTRRGPA
ncbi:MAG TPA: lysophospholipid acyltransferase family protein [Burkholderiaceae bacterium]|nr:lysophospholipid acyltransferase family protein [Burkholderiaceae bacterium]